MSNAVQIIPLTQLALAFIPVALVLVIMQAWSLGARTGLLAVVRMLLQLLLIGYLLNWIFATESSPVVLFVLCFMILVASWIALRPLPDWTARNYGHVLFAISLGGGATLALISLGVLQLEPWYAPRQIVPLGGMIFASAMNTVSLSAERFAAESARGLAAAEARHEAYSAGLIPLLNSLFAVGLVALPGMMTGQILSGVSPLVAVRYQIMVMCMLTGASGLAAAIYLLLAARSKT